jgi:hypothetical protein
MLQTISWKDYFITIGLGTALYYGWWLIRYYPGWQKRQPDPPEGKPAEKAPAENRLALEEKTVIGAVATSNSQEQQQADQLQTPQTPQPQNTEESQGPQSRQPDPPQGPQPQQPAPPQPELPFPHPAFLATTAANCKNDLLRIFEKASMAKPSEREWVELLRSVLTADPYPKLSGTIFQENIDALIVREMARYGSIHLTPEVVRELWKLDG